MSLRITLHSFNYEDVKSKIKNHDVEHKEKALNWIKELYGEDFKYTENDTVAAIEDVFKLGTTDIPYDKEKDPEGVSIIKAVYSIVSASDGFNYITDDWKISAFVDAIEYLQKKQVDSRLTRLLAFFAGKKISPTTESKLVGILTSLTCGRPLFENSPCDEWPYYGFILYSEIDNNIIQEAQIFAKKIKARDRGIAEFMEGAIIPALTKSLELKNDIFVYGA